PGRCFVIGCWRSYAPPAGSLHGDAANLRRAVRPALLDSLLDLVAGICTDRRADGRGQIAIADVSRDRAADEGADRSAGNAALVARLVCDRFFVALLAHRGGGGRRGWRRRGRCGSRGGLSDRGRGRRRRAGVVRIVLDRTVLRVCILIERILLDHYRAVLPVDTAEELIRGHSARR